MTNSAAPVESTAPAPKPEMPVKEGNTAPPPPSRWKKYVTPLLVVLLALAVLITVTRKWNSWEGGHVEQVTDDAYVRGDLTPLSTKVAGIVKSCSRFRLSGGAQRRSTRRAGGQRLSGAGRPQGPQLARPKKMHSRRRKSSDRQCGPTMPTGSATYWPRTGQLSMELAASMTVSG